MPLRTIIGGALGAAAVASALVAVSGSGQAAVSGADARRPVSLTIAHARISRTTGQETLQAYLTDGAGRHPVGRRIAFTSRHGYPLCAAATDGTGVAECRVDPSATRADPDEMLAGVRATFAGDRTYRPATGTAPTDVIFP
ncbi:MAG TPA: hypothetical protein VGL93_13185 [Streptosporangiaceae bacterium]|jgi:hypothetical protein